MLPFADLTRVQLLLAGQLAECFAAPGCFESNLELELSAMSFSFRHDIDPHMLQVIHDFFTWHVVQFLGSMIPGLCRGKAFPL